MESLRQYIISVVTAALLCGIVTGMVQEGKLRELIKFVCSLFLAITILYPITGFNVDELTAFSIDFSNEATAAASSGKKRAQESTADIIKAECEAYILDKAHELDAELIVEITVSDDDPPIPIAASISGNVSPYIRLQLEEIIQEDLGITKENQSWTG